MQEKQALQEEQAMVPFSVPASVEHPAEQMSYQGMEEDPLPEFAEMNDTPVLFYQLLLVMLVAALFMICYFLFPDFFEGIRTVLHQLFGTDMDFVAWGKQAGEVLQTMLSMP